MLRKRQRIKNINIHITNFLIDYPQRHSYEEIVIDVSDYYNKFPFVKKFQVSTYKIYIYKIY